MSLVTSNPPKFLHAAWKLIPRAITKMLKLVVQRKCSAGMQLWYVILPHPFPYRELLQCKILRIHEDHDADVVDRAEPIVFRGVKVCVGFNTKDRGVPESSPVHESNHVHD